MNILLVAIDTLSARHMGCYGYHRNTTPFIDALARESVLFESLYCQAIPTQPSYTSVFTGQYAITHGIVSHGGTRDLSPSTPTLAEILASNGYTTCAVDNLPTHHKPWFGRGYQYIMSPETRGEYSQTITWEHYNDLAVPWLKAHAHEKFFLFIHYWDPHTPYLPPPRYRDLFYTGDPCDPNNHSLDGLWRHPFGEPWKQWFDRLRPGITDAEYIVAMYDSEIRFVDDGLRQLLDALAAFGLADDTLVLVFSDHGEMMYQHGIYFDHHGLYDDDLHVPLIIRWPGHMKAGRRVPHLVQHIDIAPTLLAAAGLAIPSTMEGHNLLPYLTGDADEPLYPFLVAEECTRMMKWAIRTNEYKFILSRERDYRNGPLRELYDLRADPDELVNLCEQRSDVAAHWERVLTDWIATMMRKNGLTEDPLVANGLTLAADWFKWVKEHGYW